MTSNTDSKTIEGFGAEWTRFDHHEADPAQERMFQQYFRLFPWDKIDTSAVGFDVGCGSGRWDRFVAPRVARLHCIDASSEALNVARSNLRAMHNCEFHHASVAEIPLADGSMDFGFSLGVLHHVPDTAGAIATCVRKLRPGAPLLLYLYYRFDNRPRWYAALWRASDVARRRISQLPDRFRFLVSDGIAAGVYWPLATLARGLEAINIDVGELPLSSYRDKSFYVMRNDALDRFGTVLEQRFTRDEIRSMMQSAGLTGIEFSDEVPFWCALGYKQG